MKFALVLLAAASGLSVGACDLVPGTPANRAKVALSGYLLDPGSAKITVLKSTPDTLCGTVNAKNRMGAYVGATPFLVDGKYATPVVFSEPTISDYSTWSDNPNTSSGHEAYSRMEDGCAFKATWAKTCDASSAEAIIVDEEFCKAWRAKDWAALRDQRGY